MEGSRSEDARSQRERMLAGDLYTATDPVLADERRRAAELVGEYNAAPAGADDVRRLLLEQLLGSIGMDVEIRAPFHCDYGS